MVLLFLLGAFWDVAWHVEIGRDTFWSPPHLLIYLGVLIVLGSSAAALVGAWSAVGGFAVPQDRTAVVDFLRDPATLLAVAAAAVLAREVSVWGGSLIAGRARGVKRRNAERDAAAQS